MRQFQVEINNSTRLMDFSQLSAVMDAVAVAELMDQLSVSYSIPINFMDGTKARLRQAELLEKPQPLIKEVPLPIYEVMMSTSIPITLRVFVIADNETDAENAVKTMIENGKLTKKQIPNLKEEADAELHHWITQVDGDDWVIGDALLSEQDNKSETLR